MKRTLTAVGASLAVLLTGSAAGAQTHGDLGSQGQFIISADRLMPLFAFNNLTQDDIVPGGLGPGVSSRTTTNNETTMSFFVGSTGPAPDSGFFSAPRVGLDYVVVPNVTIGGNLILLFTLGGSTTQETDLNNGSNTKQSNDNPGVTAFGIAPRGGYILQLTDLFSLWLRGGFSFITATSKTSNGNTTTSVGQNQFALDLEPQFVVTPFPHIGFTAGLDMDIPLAGGHSVDTNTNGSSQSASAHQAIFYLGVVLGMLAHF